VAKLYFPDEILDYSPPEMLALQNEQQQKQQRGTSAFETYLETTGIWPKAWEGLTEPPLGHSSDRVRVTPKTTPKTTTTTTEPKTTTTNGVP